MCRAAAARLGAVRELLAKSNAEQHGARGRARTSSHSHNLTTCDKGPHFVLWAELRWGWVGPRRGGHNARFVSFYVIFRLACVTRVTRNGRLQRPTGRPWLRKTTPLRPHRPHLPPGTGRTRWHVHKRSRRCEEHVSVVLQARRGNYSQRGGGAGSARAAMAAAVSQQTPALLRAGRPATPQASSASIAVRESRAAMFLSLPDLEVADGSASAKVRALSSPMFHSSDGSSDDEPAPLAFNPRARMPRCSSFSHRLEMDDFSGNVMPAAVCLGDIDNDGTNELVVGSMGGDLAVFKGIERSTAWRRATGLGSIACCAVSDGLLWEGHTSLAVVTVEGWLHLFHLFPDWRAALPAAASASASASSSPKQPRRQRQQRQQRFAPLRSSSLLRPVHTERVPLNGCALLVRNRYSRRRRTQRRYEGGHSGGSSSAGHEPSGNGSGGGCELCLGSTDGTVYCLQLSNAAPHPPGLSLTLQITMEWSVAFPLRSIFLQPKPHPQPQPHLQRQRQRQRDEEAKQDDDDEEEEDLELCCCVQNRVGGYFVLDPPPGLVQQPRPQPQAAQADEKSPLSGTTTPTAAATAAAAAPLGMVRAIPLIPPKPTPIKRQQQQRQKQMRRGGSSSARSRSKWNSKQRRRKGGGGGDSTRSSSNTNGDDTGDDNQQQGEEEQEEDEDAGAEEEQEGYSDEDDDDDDDDEMNGGLRSTAALETWVGTSSGSMSAAARGESIPISVLASLQGSIAVVVGGRTVQTQTQTQTAAAAAGAASSASMHSMNARRARQPSDGMGTGGVTAVHVATPRYSTSDMAESVAATGGSGESVRTEGHDRGGDDGDGGGVHTPPAAAAAAGSIRKGGAGAGGGTPRPSSATVAAAVSDSKAAAMSSLSLSGEDGGGGGGDAAGGDAAGGGGDAAGGDAAGGGMVGRLKLADTKVRPRPAAAAAAAANVKGGGVGVGGTLSYTRQSRAELAAEAREASGELMWRHGLGAEFCAVGLLDLDLDAETELLGPAPAATASAGAGDTHDNDDVGAEEEPEAAAAAAAAAAAEDVVAPDDVDGDLSSLADARVQQQQRAATMVAAANASAGAAADGDAGAGAVAAAKAMQGHRQQRMVSKLQLEAAVPLPLPLLLAGGGAQSDHSDEQQPGDADAPSNDQGEEQDEEQGEEGDSKQRAGSGSGVVAADARRQNQQEQEQRRQRKISTGATTTSGSTGGTSSGRHHASPSSSFSRPRSLPTVVACAHDGSTVFISGTGEELWCTAGQPVVACVTGHIGVSSSCSENTTQSIHDDDDEDSDDQEQEEEERGRSVGCVAWVTAGGGILLAHSIRPQQLRLTTAVDLLLPGRGHEQQRDGNRSRRSSSSSSSSGRRAVAEPSPVLLRGDTDMGMAQLARERICMVRLPSPPLPSPPLPCLPSVASSNRILLASPALAATVRLCQF
eukprot:COSAG06_NODE_1872_length_8166_cov_74.691211_5_plen_1426_part_00